MTTRSRRPSTDSGRWLDEHGNEIEESDRGLVYDLRTLVDRRRMLGLFGGVGAAALLAACGGGATGATSGAATSPRSPRRPPAPTRGRLQRPQRAGRLGHRPQRHPLELRLLHHHRRGRALEIKLTVRDAATGDVLQGRGVPVALRPGRQLLPLQPGRRKRELPARRPGGRRGGTATFTSIFPACYSGRWPHVHFEVYGSLSDATSSGPIVKTSQIALPKEACEAVYATAGYEQSVSNLSRVSLAGDMVFGDDGGIHQLATMSGDADGGYVAALTIGV